MTYHLKFTLLWMAVLQRQLQVFTEMIQRQFSWSSYDLHPNIIPAKFFWVKCVRFSPCHDREFWKRPGEFQRFRRISEDFRSLPKNKCPLTVPEDVWALSKLLKTTLLACFGMISFEQKKGHYVLRTICPDLWTRREKLSLMRGIDVFSPKA